MELLVYPLIQGKLTLIFGVIFYFADNCLIIFVFIIYFVVSENLFLKAFIEKRT